MDHNSIRQLLDPFLSDSELDSEQMEKIVTFLELLLRWNEKTNLTAIRTTEEIITRHFGESFFLATQLCQPEQTGTAFDFGSGAGFPGIPLAIYSPDMLVTLIESQNKKATFLKEVIRALELKNVNVFAGRGKVFTGNARLVTLRSVEKFEESVTVAMKLVSPAGRLALLITQEQVEMAKQSSGPIQFSFVWDAPKAVPQSRALVLLVGNRQ